VFTRLAQANAPARGTSLARICKVQQLYGEKTLISDFPTRTLTGSGCGQNHIERASSLGGVGIPMS
jgi:hypothetical protein